MSRKTKKPRRPLRERLLSVLLDGRIALYSIDDGSECDDGPLLEVADALRWVCLACDVSGLVSGQQRELKSAFDTCAALIHGGTYDATKTRALDCALATAATVIDAHLKPEALALAWAILSKSNAEK